MDPHRFGIAIVGSGMIAREHANVIRRLDKARLVAVCGSTRESAGRFADEFGCEAYSELDEMLKRPDIHIVVICTPSGLHGAQTIACAEAGKHIITEKPMDIRWERVQAMLETCRRNKVKLTVISQNRFQSDIVRAKELVDSGRLGTIAAANAAVNWYRTQEYYDSSAWRGTWEWDGGGALMNQGIHTVDLLQYLAGPVESVFARHRTASHERIEVEDVAALTLQYKHGGIGTLFASTGCYPGLQTRIELFGSGGTLILENNKIVTLHIRGQETSDDPSQQQQASSGVSPNPSSSNPVYAVGDTHLLQYLDLIDAIEQDREPSMNGEEGAKPVAIILAAYLSAQSGLIVPLEQHFSL